MGLTSSTNPAVYGPGGDNVGLPAAPRVVNTYKAAAATSYAVGDFILVDTAAGTISKCTATDSVFDGVVMEAKDNSSGVAGGMMVPVIQQGWTYVDGLISKTGGANDDLIGVGATLYLGAVSTTAGTAVGQSAVATAGGGVKIGRAFDNPITALPTVDTAYKIRAYIDALSRGCV